MRKRALLIRSVLVLSIVFMLAVSAYAEVNVSYGTYFRLRQETWDNLFDMNIVDTTSAPGLTFTRPDDNYWRLKTSVWFKAEKDKEYVFYTKLTNEARYFMETGNAASRPAGMNKDEIVIDNLYVAANKFLGLPVDLTIGRQDFLMTYGDGFLIMDGTPVDGSRTFYFNAAKAAIKFNDQYGVDLVYITNQNFDRALPSLYSPPKRQLNTSDEQGTVVYGRAKISENLLLEPYYMRKREEGVSAGPVPAAASVSALELNTVGARAVVGFGGGWKLRAEYAHQFGDYANGTDREGDGGQIYIGRKYENVALKPSFELGYAYLSGDDPNTTTKIEGWNPLFSRWPWLSELYVLSYAVETGIVGYWTNLQIARANFRLQLTPETALDLAYNYLLANENVPGPIFSADGKHRGDLIQAKVSHKFSKTVDGYLLVEDFVPGDFYREANRDNAMFVRWELQVKI